MFQIDPQHNTYMLVFQCQEKNKTYNIEVDPDVSIGELALELKNALDCQPNQNIKLYFQDEELQNNRTIKSYQIGKGRIIDVKIVISQNMADNQPASNEMNINILVPVNQNKSYNIVVKKDETIGELRSRFSTSIQLASTKKLTFIFEGTALIDLSKTIQQIGIEEQGTLIARIETDGGN